MPMYQRLITASKAAGVHLLFSLFVASLAAGLVFGLWYPYPYREFAGGRALFLLVVGVDIICGPLLTMVIFNPLKPRKELFRDLLIIVFLQLAALGYGLWTVWQARPLFLVHEIDRFKVIAAPDVDALALAALPPELQPHWLSGPQIVTIREADDTTEREKVLQESIQGGRDFGERPEFYIPYIGTNTLKSLKRAKPLIVFLQKWPEQQVMAKALAADKGADMAQWLYLPVVARQDWVAVLDKQGQIQGFLKGDGF